MFPFFSYTHHRDWFVYLFFFLSLPLFLAVHMPDDLTKLTASIHPNNTWRGLLRFIDAGKGSNLEGMAELKRYFNRFGYLSNRPENINFTDFFDDELEKALISYQKNLGLSETGKLDYQTMKVIVKPRCGIKDLGANGGEPLKTSVRYNYFYGEPRWTRRKPMMLTYAFSMSNMIDYVSLSDVRAAVKGAFAKWSAVIPVNFTETEEYSFADIKIGWYSGDHGDGEAFDGVLGVLAHAFSPENGRLHLDLAERWAVDFSADRSKVAVDLESVATHEIGHVLGLAHSPVKEAMMYPSLSPRKMKRELRKDDVEGIQALYGSNPSYRYDSRWESDLSSGRGMDLDRKALTKWIALSFIVWLGLV